MKKVNLILTMLMAAACVFFATGCQNDATADDGKNIRDYSKIDPDGGSSGGGSGGGGGSTVNWALCKNGSYDIFDIQVWGDGAGEFDFANKDGYSTFTIKTVGGGWVGGGMIASDTSKTFDFSKVAKMTFEIRGTINAKALCVAVQDKNGGDNGIYPAKQSLVTNAKISSISKDEWTKAEIDVTKAKTGTIINAFMIIGAADWGSNIKAGDYFDVRNLDWIDADGNSVTLTLK